MEGFVSIDQQETVDGLGGVQGFEVLGQFYACQRVAFQGELDHLFREADRNYELFS